MISPRGLSMGGRNVSTFAKFTILLLLFLISFNFNAKWAWRLLFRPNLRPPPIRRMGKSKPDIFMAIRRTLEKIFTHRGVISQTRGSSERLARFVFPIQQSQQMPASGPIRLIAGYAA